MSPDPLSRRPQMKISDVQHVISVNNIMGFDCQATLLIANFSMAKTHKIFIDNIVPGGIFR